MQRKILIQFAEEKIEQFKNDLLLATQEENELPLILIQLNDKKNGYWNQIMDNLQVLIEPNHHHLAYSDMSIYHSQFQNMLTEFNHSNRKLAC